MFISNYHCFKCLFPVYRPPRKVVVTSWNETTAVIEWHAPDSSVFNTIGYTIACWQSGLQENTSIFVSYDAEVCASTCLMEATLTGLKPATNHSIQVMMFSFNFFFILVSFLFVFHLLCYYICFCYFILFQIMLSFYFNKYTL